jgi:hypothetical protein
MTLLRKKPVMSFKQIACHRMVFFEMKSTCLSDFPGNVT